METPETSLTSEYPKVRNQVVLAGGLLIAFDVAGVTIDGPLPLLKMRVEDPAAVGWALLAIVTYCLIRMALEWQRLPACERRRLHRRIDAALTGLIGVSSVVVFILPPGFDIGLSWGATLWAMIALLPGLVAGILLSALVPLLFVMWLKVWRSKGCSHDAAAHSQ